MNMLSFFFPPLVFLGLHPQHMEVARLGVEYTTAMATAKRDPSHICDLHCSSQQPTEWDQGLNPCPHEY